MTRRAMGMCVLAAAALAGQLLGPMQAVCAAQGRMACCCEGRTQDQDCGKTCQMSEAPSPVAVPLLQNAGAVKIRLEQTSGLPAADAAMAIAKVVLPVARSYSAALHAPPTKRYLQHCILRV